jgi:hypothetical protein
MKRPMLASALAVPLLLAGCATTTMVPVWRDPTYAAVPVKRVFVTTLIANPQYTLAFENAVAQAFASQGVQVATGSSVFPPGEAITKEKVVEYVKANGAQLLIVMRLTEKTTVEAQPVTVTTYGYGYGYGVGTAYTTVTYAPSTTVRAESDVYATSTEKLVWSGKSSTFDFSSAQQAGQSAASALVVALAESGILVK